MCFMCAGLPTGSASTACVKAARRKDTAIANETQILSQLREPVFPRLIEYSEQGAFSMTEALPGARLSAIVGENKGLESLAYMDEYGEAMNCIRGFA